MRVGINWAGGGLPTVTKVVDGAPGAFPNPEFGQLEGLGVALFVLVVILGLIRWGTGFVANVAVLLGIIAGADSPLLGVMHFDQVVHGALGRYRHAIAFRHAEISTRPDHHDVHRHGRGHDRIAGMFLALGEMTGRNDRSGRRCPRPARRWRRHHPRRHFQYISLYVVLAKCRPGRRDRRALALGHRDRRRHHAGARTAAQDVGTG